MFVIDSTLGRWKQSVGTGVLRAGEQNMLVSVRDIMTEHVVAIDPSGTVKEAVELLLRHSISGLPVIDAHNRLVGLVSEYDLLTNLITAEPTSNPVSHYMMHDVRTVAPEDNVLQVAERFLASRDHRYPVVENGRLIGIVSRRDVMRLIESVRDLNDDLSATEAELASV
jgi:CBS domain-containing protein